VLFDSERHERLIEDAWSPNAIEGAIREIVADAEAAFDDGWPSHPEDSAEPRRFRTVYLGGAGVIRALDELQRRGLVELTRDYAPYLEEEYVPDFPEDDHERSLLMGETGIRLVLQRLSPSGANADRLAELIGANARDERRELMWGSPGTMLAAAELHRATGEPRWADLWRESASWLVDESDPESGIWTQELYGSTTRYLGPAHGFAGCMLALAAFPPAAANVHERAAAVTRRYAVEEDGLANWPPLAGMPLRTRDGQIRVQWCHGAPGIVASLAVLAPDDSEHERLLCAGGELTWRAGPLAKGAGLCHGTAGNGYAFLALLKRTGGELWLERARSFAVHAAAQVAREHAAHGHGRFTLWTGDLGTALYLADCLAGGGTLPLP
jgi:lantibiotic modifying enzyme